MFPTVEGLALNPNDFGNSHLKYNPRVFLGASRLVILQEPVYNSDTLSVAYAGMLGRKMSSFQKPSEAI